MKLNWKKAYLAPLRIGRLFLSDILYAGNRNRYHLATKKDFVEKFPDARTFPQITMDGEYIGGFTELDAHLG